MPISHKQCFQNMCCAFIILVGPCIYGIYYGATNMNTGYLGNRSGYLMLVIFLSVILGTIFLFCIGHCIADIRENNRINNSKIRREKNPKPIPDPLTSSVASVSIPVVIKVEK